MTRVLIYGCQTDIGSILYESLKGINDIELSAIHFQIPTLSNFAKSNYKDNRVIIQPFGQADRERDLIKCLNPMMRRKFDYVINCHEQPLKLWSEKNPTVDLCYNCQDGSTLGKVLGYSHFDGLLINLSSFEVYGTAPSAIPLELKDSRYEMLIPKTGSEEEQEEKFGYDFEHGISEKMFYSPKELYVYGMHKMLLESHLSKHSQENGFNLLNLRLPYMIQYGISDDSIIYTDRINRILYNLRKGLNIQSSTDKQDYSVYDFLTPFFVSDFIKSIIVNSEIFTGTYNMGSGMDNEFSELEFLKALYSIKDINIDYLENTPDSWGAALPYYVADTRLLHQELETQITQLSEGSTITKMATEYLEWFINDLKV